MPKVWDTWTITFAGAVLGLLASLGHILADRSSVAAAGPVVIGYVLLYIIVAAGIFAAVSALRNRLVRRGGS